eukprot:221900-Prymnesium_polylepis.1
MDAAARLPQSGLRSLPRRYLPVAVPANEGGGAEFQQNRSAQPHVRQLVFFATHVLAPLDIRLFRHYSRQLRYAQPPSMARLWVLLYRPDEEGVQALLEQSRDIEAGACVWGDGTVRRALPALAANAERDAANTPDPNHRRYFWFHSSLLLWNRTFGHAYPNVRYLWRVEPDVLFAGSWTSLLGLADRQEADLVLPQLTTHTAHPGYPHWGRNKHILADTPRDEWCYSLVSIGRYSLRFLDMMARKWVRGVTGYEEILLPMSCTERAGCTRRSFHRMRAPGWRKAHLTDYFRYRPDWACGTFLKSAAAHTQELWHPVKHRECWAAFLDSCTARGCAKVPPPD